MNEICQCSIRELRRRVVEKEVSVCEISRSFLDRIEQVDHHTRAFLAVEADQLLEAAASGNVETVKTLLAAGVDVNGEEGSTPFGATPLHYAALDGRKEVVELLIAAGANVNAKVAKEGGTPLDLAILDKHTETADLLRKHGGKTGEELKAEGK